MKPPDKVTQTRSNIQANFDSSVRANSVEKLRFRENSAKVTRYLNGYPEFAAAIEQCKLDYTCEYETWDDCCREEWGITRQRAQQLLGAEKVRRSLPENVNRGLQNERQVRELAKAPAESREIVFEAVAQKGEVTAEAIRSEVKARFQPEIQEAESRDIELTVSPETNVSEGQEAASNEESNSESYDPLTGEVPECLTCQSNLDLLRACETEKRSWIFKYKELVRDKESDMQDDPVYPEAVKLFRYWCEKSGHLKSRFAFDRFEECKGYLKKDGLELCKKAVDGLCFDPFTTKRKNGTTKKHDDFELAFRDRKHFEECCNKAPLPKKGK